MADGSDFDYVDLGHEEAVDEALVYQDAVASLQAKLSKLSDVKITVDTSGWNATIAALSEQMKPAVQAAGISAQKLAAAFSVPLPILGPLAGPDCTCGKSVETYDGPDIDCPSHGQCAAAGHETGPDGGCHCGAVPAPEAGKVMQGPDGVIQMWDGEKWVLAVDPAKPSEPTDLATAVKKAKAAMEAQPLKGPLATFSMAKDGKLTLLSDLHWTPTGNGMKITYAGDWNPDTATDEDLKEIQQLPEPSTISFNAGTIDPETVKLLMGFPIDTVSTEPEPEEIPALFQDDLPPAAQVVSSGMWCMACNEHWNEHQGDPVACDSGGYVRPALPHEEKAWRDRQQQKAQGQQ